MAYELHQLCGWRPDQKEWDRLADQVNAQPVKYLAPFRGTPGPPIWEIAKQVNGDQPLPSMIQEIGDCVSFGACHAGNYTAAYEIGWLGQEETWHCWFPPFVYGVSRCAPDLGNGQLGNGDGSLGSWGAGAMQKYGALFVDDPGVPFYTGNVARSWGYKGPPKEFYLIAKPHVVEGISPVTSAAELRERLCNYKPCTLAWMYDMADRPQKVSAGGKDFGVLRDAGVLGGHQVCVIAWDDDLPGALMQNSWPHSLYNGYQFNGEPAGSAWITAKSLERIFRSDMMECYSLALFHGEPAPPDWTPGIVADVPTVPGSEPSI